MIVSGRHYEEAVHFLEEDSPESGTTAATSSSTRRSDSASSGPCKASGSIPRSLGGVGMELTS